MDKKYLLSVAENKAQYHKNQALLPYEEKFKKIIEFQKINAEMVKSNKSRYTTHKVIKVWQPE